MLHHPFRAIEELLEWDGTRFPSFTATYQHCSLVHTHPHDVYGKDLGEETEELFEEEDTVPADKEKYRPIVLESIVTISRK